MPPVESSSQTPALMVLWRRKWLILAVVLAFAVATAIVSKSLPKVYESTATLWITQDAAAQSFDAVQAGQVLARTYGNVADSKNLASTVANDLPFEATGGGVLQKVSFEPIAETQLLKITAEDREPARAQLIANVYAATLIEYAGSRLSDATDSTISLADRASFPSQAARPKPTFYTIVGAIFGLLLGVGLAYLAELLDRRVRSEEDLQVLTNVPVLGRIPKTTSSTASTVSYDEAFRLLRANLQFAKPEGRLRSVAVVSPSEGDGKSSTSLGLARAFADGGERVLVVEADMRRPGLQRHVFPTRDGTSELPGLSSYLAGVGALDEVLYETVFPGIRFLPAGPIPPAPSSLLQGPRGQQLLTRLAEDVSVVIVDTPPLSVAAEASLLAAEADGTLMVLDLARSSRQAIRKATEQLEVVRADLLGVVLNRLSLGREQGAYAYRYVEPEPPRRRRSAERARAG
jgi:capsular exopolysaccharide synthesis family protein